VPAVVGLCERSYKNEYGTMNRKYRWENIMKKVTGIGGIFFICKDPDKIKEWYQKNLAG
jgi:hypothetical protein